MERRKLTRVDFDMEALIKYNSEEIKGMVENISLKGILVKASEEREISIGQNVNITLCIVGSNTKLDINLQGKLVRHDEKGLGFRYDKIDLDSFIHLKNIVAYNSESYEKIINEFVEATKEEGQI
jgi:hypothetical protein